MFVCGIELTPKGVQVCFGDHAKGSPCEFQEFVHAIRLHEAEVEIDALRAALTQPKG
jgi:hypothetical protein